VDALFRFVNYTSVKLIRPSNPVSRLLSEGGMR
jgi:hypothetical protein